MSSQLRGKLGGGGGGVNDKQKKHKCNVESHMCLHEGCSAT